MGPDIETSCHLKPWQGHWGRRVGLTVPGVPQEGNTGCLKRLGASADELAGDPAGELRQRPSQMRYCGYVGDEPRQRGSARRFQEIQERKEQEAGLSETQRAVSRAADGASGLESSVEVVPAVSRASGRPQGSPMVQMRVGGGESLAQAVSLLVPAEAGSHGGSRWRWKAHKQPHLRRWRTGLSREKARSSEN